MQADSGLAPEDHGEIPLPPATTQWRPLSAPADETAAPLAPFVPAQAYAPTEAAPQAERAEPMPWEDDFAQETGHAAPPWEDEQSLAGQPEPAEADVAPAPAEGRAFPLDAFIIPEDAHRIPAGIEISEELQRQIVEDVAARLEQLAARLRTEGLGTLVAPSRDHEPVDVVLAAVISGYVSRKAH